MPIRTSYKHGTPSWTDLATSDMEAAKEFYGKLFGWTAETSPEPEAMGYTVFMKGEHAVAGCASTWGEMPTCWSTYVTVENVDEAVAAAREAGGEIFMEGCDVLEAGRMAVIKDPTGAYFSIWQAKEHIGAEVVNEHGALCWSELITRDTEKAKEFYGKIFGWGALQVSDPNVNTPYDYRGWTTADGSESSDIVEFSDTWFSWRWFLLGSWWTTAGSSESSDIVGGMIRMDEKWPDEVPPHWMTYFAVDDCDAAAAKVTELKGTVLLSPIDIPPGRFAVVEDPQGAAFTIIHINEQPDRSGEAREEVAAAGTL